MIITDKIARVREERWSDPTLSWGLVPTMGYLHEGHLSLVRQARAENERVAVSIFVNPTQFAPNEDLSSYPRDLRRDLMLLEREGVDLVFTPDEDEMYPSGFQTIVKVEDITKPLEGASRPTHFQGVTTVVAKLFNILQPTRAYFGQKDAQQSIVVRRMVVDLNFNLEIVVSPIIRESDGLAMSSRNIHLSAEQRAAAPVLQRALEAAANALSSGEKQAETLRQIMAEAIAAEPLARLDYVSAVHPQTLLELNEVKDEVLLSLAVFFGQVRLIDNLWLTHPFNRYP